MKMKNFSVIALALGLSLTVKAQSSNSTTEIKSGWNTVYLQYGLLGFSGDNSEDLDGINGFTLGYNRAIGISKQLPLYLEVGGTLTYATGTVYEYGYEDVNNNSDFNSTVTHNEKTKMTLMYVKVPITLTYNYQISDSKFFIAPYIGVTGRYIFSGEQKETTTETDVTKWSSAYGGSTDTDYSSDETKWNLYDEEDMGEDNTWTRFQFGWQIGVNLKYKNLLVGISYGSDFSEIADDLKTNNLSFSLGYCF